MVPKRDGTLVAGADVLATAVAGAVWPNVNVLAGALVVPNENPVVPVVAAGPRVLGMLGAAAAPNVKPLTVGAAILELIRRAVVTAVQCLNVTCFLAWIQRCRS